ncbi:acyl-CoA dehydrogenase family protein, partial [Nocardia gipuzkoensis]
MSTIDQSERPRLAEGCGLLWRERQTLRRYLPELDEHFAHTPMLTMEDPASDIIDRFKAAGGTGLTVPVELGGPGASVLDVLRIQRAIGCASPSLAAGSTMHHLSMATLVEYARLASPEEMALVHALVEQRALIASGFAEGKTGASAFVPTMHARKDGGDYVINGSKRPCSLSRSMDLLTASVAVPGEGAARRAVALIPAASQGLSVRPFWQTWVLAGAQSDEVVLEDVRVPADLVILNDEGDPEGVHEMTGYLWFGLLITAGYLG